MPRKKKELTDITDMSVDQLLKLPKDTYILRKSVGAYDTVKLTVQGPKNTPNKQTGEGFLFTEVGSKKPHTCLRVFEQRAVSVFVLQKTWTIFQPLSTGQDV